MKACVLHGINDFRYEEIDKPTLKTGEVLVRVREAGICGSDIPRIFTTGTYHFPTIPGHEFAGEVVEAYDEENKNLVGQRAAIFPLIPCRSCNSCQKGNYELCKHYNYLGSRCDGGFAEYVAVPAWNIAPIPDELSFEEAAMTEPVAVALHALRQAKIEIGDTVVIYGPGTIGILIAQWAAAWGASKIMLVGTDNTNYEYLASLGFEHFISFKQQDPTEWVMKHTKGIGADVAIEAVGAASTFCNCLETVAPGGKILAVGNPKGDFVLPKNTYWQLLRKQISIVGTWNSSFDNSNKNDWLISIDAMATGKIAAKKLITHKFPLENIYDGLNIMKNSSEPYKKIIVEI